MKLFAKNKKNKLVEQDAMSAVLNPETLQINAEPTSTPDLEKIIKTTESLNIVSAINNAHPNASQTSNKNELANVREAIYRSFDLARRKIATEYEQIIVSGNFIDNPFLAVQIVVKNYDKKWNVEYVESIIKKFTDSIPENISLGKTVYITDDLVIEPIMYVDKLLPSWKITPSFALLTNALKWQDLVEKLIKDGELSQDSKEIISELIEAITLNVKNGYYVKLSRLVLLQLYPGSAQKIVLFSNDTLTKMNEIYARFLKTGERKQINKYDTISHFERTQENIKNGFLTEEAADAVEKIEFVPMDLTEEIPQETSKEEKQQQEAEKIQEEITNAQEAISINLEVKEEVKVNNFNTNEFIISEVKEVKPTKNKEISIISASEVSKKEVVKPSSKNEIKKISKPTAKPSKKNEETQEFNLIEKTIVAKKPTAKPKAKAEVKKEVKVVTTTTTTKVVKASPATKANAKKIIPSKEIIKTAEKIEVKKPVKKPVKK